VTVGSQAAPDRIGDCRLVLNNENAQILLLGRRNESSAPGPSKVETVCDGSEPSVTRTLWHGWPARISNHQSPVNWGQFNQVGKGNHFAPSQEPEVFSERSDCRLEVPDVR
jgi:hypothetical protein